jgi:hypothetical protein
MRQNIEQYDDVIAIVVSLLFIHLNKKTSKYIEDHPLNFAEFNRLSTSFAGMTAFSKFATRIISGILNPISG